MNLEKIGKASMLVMMVAGMSGCGHSGSRASIELENYEYAKTVEYTLADTIEGESGSRYWRCTAEGVLPVRIDGEEVRELRDTLMSIAAVTFEKGEAAPRLPEGYGPELLDPEKTEACSVVANNVDVALITPRVMVWHIYHYAYPCGAAHGVFSNNYINYSFAGKKVLSLSDIFKPGYEERLRGLLRGELGGRDDLIVDPEDAEIPEVFRLTADGVEFVYGIFSVAPYSSGEVAVRLTAYSVANLLSEEGKSIFGI